MHESLISDRLPLLANVLPRPVCPIIDAHMHVGEDASVARYLSSARAYGVERALALTRDRSPSEVAKLHAGFFLPTVWGDWPGPDDGQGWIDEQGKRLTRARQDGAVALKFKSTPKQPRHRQDGTRMFLDEARLER